MTGAQAIVGETEFGIECDGPIEVLDSVGTIRLSHCAKDEAGKPIAATQKFLVSFSVYSCGLRQSRLLIWTQFQTQTIDDALRDLVLHSDNVVGRSIHSIAPDDLAALHIQQLGVDAEALADMDKACGQHCVHVQLTTDVGWIGRLSLILRHHRRWPHHQRTNARQLSYNRICYSELV